MKIHSKSISGAEESCDLWNRATAFFILLLVGIAFNSAWADSPPTVRYTLSLANAATHQLHVKISIPAGMNEREMQLPVWNALYQVRDFAQYINWVKATNNSGNALAIRKIDKTTWQIDGANEGGVLEYEITADNPGPYGAQVNTSHAFLN